MAKMVVRLEAVKRRDIAGRGRHNSRTGYVPERIDKTRMPLNMTLVGSDDACEAIWQDILGCDMARGKVDGGNDVCAELVLSFSPDWIKELDGACAATELLADEKFNRWIDTSVAVLKRHGCIHAVLHMDEDTPHIHAFTSVKTERQGAKRDRSGKSQYVLNYAAHWSVDGDKKTKDFYYNAGRVSHNPKRLAAIEKKYGMKYDPEKTPCGKLQLEFYRAYADAGLDLERGESVLTRQARHKTFQQHALDMEVEKIKSEAEKAKSDAKKAIKKAEKAKAVAQAESERAAQATQAAVQAKADAQAEIDKAAHAKAVAQNETERAAQAAQAAAQAQAEAQAEIDKAAQAKAVAQNETQRAAQAAQAAAQAKAEAQQRHAAMLELSSKAIELVEGIKTLSSSLLALDVKGKGLVAYLQEMKRLADEKYKYAVFEEQRLYREAIDNALKTAEEVAPIQKEYHSLQNSMVM